MTSLEILTKESFPIEGVGEDELSALEVYLYKSGGIYLQLFGSAWYTGCARLTPDTARALAQILTEIANLADAR